jgi:hypothetical protein
MVPKKCEDQKPWPWPCAWWHGNGKLEGGKKMHSQPRWAWEPGNEEGRRENAEDRAEVAASICICVGPSKGYAKKRPKKINDS